MANLSLTCENDLILVQVLALQFLILIKASCLHRYFPSCADPPCHRDCTALSLPLLRSATLCHKHQIETSVCVVFLFWRGNFWPAIGNEADL